MIIKKNNLAPIYNFLNEIALSGSASRARTKLSKDIYSAIEEIQEDEAKLANENNGTVKDDGKILFDTPEDNASFLKAQGELREEGSIFSEKTADQFKKLYDALDNYDEKLSGINAEAYDNLLSSLEEDNEEK